MGKAHTKKASDSVWHGTSLSNHKRKEAIAVTPIFNKDRHIVAFHNEATGEIEIKRKGCITRIRLMPNGKPEIHNDKKPTYK